MTYEPFAGEDGTIFLRNAGIYPVAQPYTSHTNGILSYTAQKNLKTRERKLILIYVP